ncbi:MAG: DUF1294 domain-containing protein [Verrucomicrobia bacterium]|nr:DUF1294 domain-containing protein [Verrucomicrobiota bacterium]
MSVRLFMTKVEKLARAGGSVQLFGAGSGGQVTAARVFNRGMPTFDQFFLAWLGLTRVLAFLLFGYDKLLAGRSERRVSEFQHVLVSALGGWLGGLFAMLVFRHKTAKRSFQLKYAASFLVWGGLLYAWFAYR